MDGIDLSHRSHAIRGLKVIPCLVVNVSHEPAFAADEMMMASGICVKPCSLAEKTSAQDDPFAFEQAEGSVHGIERKGGEPLSDPGVDGFRVRVLTRARKLTIDLSSLVRRLDAVPPAPFGECPDSIFNLFGFDFHGQMS